jgi:hypothetical protein
LLFEGTHEELIPLAEKMVEKHGPLIAFDKASEPVQRPNVIQRWTEQSARRLAGLLYGDQAKLVKFLIGRGGTASYEEIQKHMGYGAQRLSGILSPITRNAQTATKDPLARLVDWRFTDKGVREYFIDVGALPLLRQVLKAS